MPASHSYNSTLEQPLQRTLPGTGGWGGRGGTGARVVREPWTGTGGLTGRGAMACRTVPLLGIKMVAGGGAGSAAGTWKIRETLVRPRYYMPRMTLHAGHTCQVTLQ